MNNNAKKVMENLVRIQLTFQGNKNGTSFRVPYTWVIREIVDPTIELEEMESKYSSDIPKEKRFETDSVIWEDFLYTDVGSVFDDNAYTLDVYNHLGVKEIAEDLDFNDFKVNVVVIDREIYETDIPIWENQTAEWLNGYKQAMVGNDPVHSMMMGGHVKSNSFKGYTRNLIEEYHLDFDETDVQVEYTVSVEKDGKTEEITSRYTSDRENYDDVWESYNPNNGWNTNEDWSGGWMEQDPDLNDLLYYAETIDSFNRDFKEEYYQNWIECADPRDIGKTQEFEVTLEELLAIDSEPRDYPDGSVKVTVTIDDVTFIEKEEEE